jgi:hypothetical protein
MDTAQAEMTHSLKTSALKFLQVIKPEIKFIRAFPIFACKDENGALNTDKQEIMNRWKQYFADLMKTYNNIDNQVQEVHTIENDRDRTADLQRSKRHNKQAKKE